MSEHGHRFRYGRWADGPDPLAPPYDIRAALDELGRSVLDGAGLRDALRDLMRRGLDGRRGLDELLDRIRRRRAEARRRGDLGGTLTRVRQLLDQAMSYERDALAADPSDTARMAELELATVPDDVARAVRALETYDWRSDDARRAYQEIQQMLRRELLDAQFAGMREAMSDPAAHEADREMLADLHALL
ncbi:MAG TPA: hypothetical protein VI076_15715, partial [Actinopolymorphaceae bacterium]